MKKSCILSLVVCSLLSSSLSAQSLEERLEALEKIVLKQEILIKKLSSMNDEVEEIDERLETVETRSFTDKIQFGLGMKVKMNNFSNKTADGKSYKANEIWRTKVNINMKAKIADNLKFTGRLTMFKNWGDSSPRNKDIEALQGRRPGGSEIYLERAYLDWIINTDSYIPLTLTLGRQPSTDGPSNHFKENTTRKGTYDALVFNAAADGAVLTANMSNVIDGLSLRYIYATPNVKDRNDTSYNGSNNISYKKAKLNGLIVDQIFDFLPFENLSQAYFVRTKDFYAISNDSNDINIGDLDLMGAMFEASKINNNIDFFFHYAQSKAKPNGKLFQNTIPVPMKMGLLTNTPNDTKVKVGEAFWTGARYSINKDWKIGAEYNRGSKNWLSLIIGSTDPLNKLSTRGEAYEVYISKNINKYANVRLGYVNITYDYTGSGIHLGSPQKISELTGPLAAGTIKETQNMYVSFNVLF